MVLRLHIYGPAFGLPSIDAECLAAIIYLQECLPADSWRLVACNEPSRNPFQQLPALQDGNSWVAGFEEITEFLQESSNGARSIHQDLNEDQRADKEALHSYIRSRGLPLLDLSLYVSSENYNSCTKSAWSELLSWPQSWIVPHRLRQKAKKRSEHLGLSALDVDSAQEKDKENEGIAAQIPKSLRKPKQTVNGLLGGSVQKTRFRLDAVTADFLDPLQEQLGDKQWLVADTMTSVDCLAIAYLAIMQTPELPQPWLKDALAKRYNKLGRWAAGHTSRAFGPPIDIEQASRGNSAGSKLPWITPESQSWYGIVSIVAASLVSSAPVLRIGYDQNEVQVPAGDKESKHKQKQMAYTKMRNRQIMYSQLLTGCIAAASGYAWLLHLGVLGFPRRTSRLQSSRRNFGEAGMLLGL